jgi:hypothetical protein
MVESVGRRPPSGLRFREERLGHGTTPTAYRCPTDDTLLHIAYWGDAVLAKCARCGGLWITAAMLDSIREHLSTAPNADTEGWLEVVLALMP